MGRARFVLLLAFLLFVPPGRAPTQDGHFSTALHQGSPAGAAHAPGEVLVRFRPTTGPVQKEMIRSGLGAERRRRFRSGGEHWRLARGLTTEQAIARLSNHPHVEFAEPNYILQTERLPDDPRFLELWGLLNYGQSGGTYGVDIDAEQAWDVTTGSRDVIVAVIDSGIDYTHPDLAANIYTNEGEIPSNGIDDDQNGFVDDVRGWDFRDNDNDPMDTRGHGTHVAGTIGAVGNNTIGMTGVAWEVSLVPLRFIGPEGLGTTADAAEAVEYAIAAGADIINASWGGPGFSQVLQDAIAEASDAGILFVTSAGNASADADVEPHYPSGFDIPGIVAVAATDHNDALAPFSNYGALTVDLAAPGVSTLSTFPFDSYGRLSGTSMAAPHVAGTAALILAVAPRVDGPALKDNLLASVEAIPDLAGRLVSGGRLNAFRALSSRETVPPGACADVVVSSPGSFSLVLTWTATGDDGDTGTASLYDVRYSTSPFDESGFASAVRVARPPRPLAAGSRQSLEIRGLASRTTYYFALQAIDDWGNAGPMSGLASGTTLDPPDIGVDPESLMADLFNNGIATRLLAIGNTGPGDLAFDLAVAYPPGGAPGGWLTVDPPSGLVPPGGSLSVLVTLNAAGLPGGDYGADLVISSTDPDEPAVVVPVRLHVTNAPDITLPATSLEFGAVFVGASHGLMLTVENDGHEVLTVDLSTNHEDFGASPASVNIPAGGREDVVVAFRPSLPLLRQGVLTLQTNDPDEDTVTVSLNGTGLVAPDLALSPAALNADILVDEIVNRVVTLENVGGNLLRFRTVIRGPAPNGTSGGTLTPGATVLIIQSVRPYETTSNEQILSDYGIRYDSIGPKQVAATDLSAYQQVIVPGDQTSSYYQILAGEADRLNAYVSSGGILEVHAASYGLTDGHSATLALPGGVGIEKNLAWITSILRPDHPLAAGLEREIVSNSFTSHCQFTNSPDDAVWVARNEGARPTLLVYRHGNGMVVAGCQPFEVARARGEPAGLILNNMIRYAHGQSAPWLSVDPPSGKVPEGGIVEITVQFDATDRPAGDYDADVLIASDDPDEPVVAIPSHMHVTGVPEAQVSTVVLDFGVVDVGRTASRFFTVSNVGSDVLTASMESDSDQVSVSASDMVLSPGERQTVTVTFNPTRSGPLTGVVTIRSNDPYDGEIGVSLSGSGRLRSAIEVSPPALDLSLLSGDIGTRSLTLRNAGTIDLTFVITALVPSWLSVDLRSGTLTPGASLDVLVGFDARVVVPGTHQTALRISSNDPDRSDLAVLVTLRVLADSDGDRVANTADNCAFAYNPLQEDSDQDLRGDACDNCPTTSNTAQGNQDSDARGDACDNCRDIPNSGQEDADGDLHGDPCDNCPSAANPDQADGTRDGSGDACQPELLLMGILEDGGESLEVRARARDPQGDPVGGRIEILDGQDVVLQDIADTLDCRRGFSPRGEIGKGIAFVSGFGGLHLPVLLDLDFALGCEDGIPDFVFAAGPCGDPLARFNTLLPLDSLTLPAAICLREVDAPGDHFNLRVLQHDQDTIALLFWESALRIDFTDRLPRQVILPGLQLDRFYYLEIEATDGFTPPVRAWTRFLYQGETRVVINNPPLSSPSAPALVECDRHGGALLTLDGTASGDPDSAPGTQDDLVDFAWLRDPGMPTEEFLGAGPVLPVTLPLGAHEVGLRLTDTMGETHTATVQVMVRDTTPPALACPGHLTLECTSANGAQAPLVSTASDACDPDPRIVNDRTPGGADGSGIYSLGTTPVSFTAADASGNVAGCGTTVIVQDTTRPDLAVSAGPAVLWPPNHTMQAVRISWKADDRCDPGPSVTLLEVTSSEPDDAPGNGDGRTVGDISGAQLQSPDGELLLRAERSASGPGRIYRLVYQAVDGSGNPGVGTAIVSVPRELGAPIEALSAPTEPQPVYGRVSIREGPHVHAPAPGRACFCLSPPGRHGGAGYDTEAPPRRRAPETR